MVWQSGAIIVWDPFESIGDPFLFLSPVTASAYDCILGSFVPA